MFVLLIEALQKHEKVLINPKLPKFKAKKRSFRDFRQNNTPVKNFQQLFVPVLQLSVEV